MKYNWLVFTSLLLVFGGCESSHLEDPSTVISYTISEPSKVKLYVINSYDVTVAVLVDGDLPAGNHSNLFSAPDLAEGIYFYVIESTPRSTGKTTTTKRLLVLDK